MIFKAIIKILIEILIAILLFILLVKYTNIFDNIDQTYIPGFKTSTIQNIKKEITDKKISDPAFSSSWKQHLSADLVDNQFVQTIQNQIKNMSTKSPNWSDNYITTSTTTTNKKSKQLINSWLDCKLPRSNQTIKNWEYVIAYQTQIANQDNVCVWEMRICKNGILLWDYQYQNCTYTVDWINNWQEVIKWASQTNHNLFTHIKWSERPKDLVQPSRYDYQKIEDYDKYDLNWHLVNWKIEEWNTRRDNLKNNLEKYKVEEIIWQQKSYSYKPCLWNWKLIKHWNYVIAYQQNQATAPELCQFEKRYCNNWILEWWRKYSNCTQITTHNEDQETYIIYSWEWPIINVPNKVNLDEVVDPIYIPNNTKIENYENSNNDWCFDIQIEQKQLSKVCQNEYLKITNLNIWNYCTDPSCYNLQKWIKLEIQSNNIANAELNINYTDSNLNNIKSNKYLISFTNNPIYKKTFNYPTNTKSIKIELKYNNECWPQTLIKELSIQ